MTTKFNEAKKGIDNMSKVPLITFIYTKDWLLMRMEDSENEYQRKEFCRVAHQYDPKNPILRATFLHHSISGMIYSFTQTCKDEETLSPNLFVYDYGSSEDKEITQAYYTDGKVKTPCTIDGFNIRKFADADEHLFAPVAPAETSAKPDPTKEPCHVCAWKHDSKLTRFENPKDKDEFYTVKDGCDRHAFLVYLHDGMKDSGDDVSLTEFMAKERRDGKSPRDILGDKLLSKLYKSSLARDRAKIRPPDFKRPAGRPPRKN